MNEKLQIIFNRWRGYSDGKEWLIEEDQEAINICYFNFQGIKLFSARVSRIENPSDSRDVTYTLFYWGQSWNAIFACQEESLLQSQGDWHVKTLINLVSDEINQYERQSSVRAPRLQDAILAYKRHSAKSSNAIWLRSEDISPPLPPKRSQPDF